MKNNLNIAICDDDEIMLEIVKKKLQTYLKEDGLIAYNIQLFNSGKQLLRSNQYFHIIFLDVEMPGIDGFTLAEEYKDLINAPIIIFLTNHRELMSKGYHVRVFRFLTKPIIDDDFQEAISSAVKEVVELKSILLEKDGKMDVIMVSDIKYIEALGEGCCIHTQFDDYITKEPLKYWEEKLSKDTMIRIHRAIIVNLRHIKNIAKNNLTLKSGEELKISVRKRNITIDALHEFMRNKRGR